MARESLAALAFVWLAFTASVVAGEDAPDCLGSTETKELSALASDDPVHCATNLELGVGKARVCQWSFAYRSAAAATRYAALSAELTSCLGARKEHSAPVNHPDSFEQIKFTSGGVTVSISLKDKGADQVTLLFVALAPVP